MKIRNHIQGTKALILLLLVGVTHIAMGSFTGSSEDKNKSQFSLKNFNRTFYKSANPFSLRAGFTFKGTEVVNRKSENGVTTINSVMKFERGNSTYIYPYKHKVIIPKFVTPSAPTVR